MNKDYCEAKRNARRTPDLKCNFCGKVMRKGIVSKTWRDYANIVQWSFDLSYDCKSCKLGGRGQ